MKATHCTLAVNDVFLYILTTMTNLSFLLYIKLMFVALVSMLVNLTLKHAGSVAGVTGAAEFMQCRGDSLEKGVSWFSTRNTIRWYWHIL